VRRQSEAATPLWIILLLVEIVRRDPKLRRRFALPARSKK
jgi:hypothetical protein